MSALHCWLGCRKGIRPVESRGVVTGVYRYICPQNQSILKNLCGCSSAVTQDGFDMIYVHVWDINILCFEIAMTS